MTLELKRFQRENYAEYAAWFVDPDLNRHLGPMDQAWLDVVLSQPESTGITWAVFRGPELVAVVETAQTGGRILATPRPGNIDD